MNPYLIPDIPIYCSIRHANFNITSFIGASEAVLDGYSPMDSGADTIFCGTDCRNEETDDGRQVQVIGCHGSVDKAFNMGTNLTTVQTTDDEKIVLRMYESICGAGKTLFAANQLRAAGHVVHNVPRKYGGKQCLKLYDGPTIPLYYKQGLCQMKTSYPTDEELQTLRVFDLTLDLPWNPSYEHDDSDMILSS